MRLRIIRQRLVKSYSSVDACQHFGNIVHTQNKVIVKAVVVPSSSGCPSKYGDRLDAKEPSYGNIITDYRMEKSIYYCP